MFDSIKNNINFGIIKKAISDKDGNINIRTPRYYNTIMLTYLQAKNELIYQKTGINMFDIADIEFAYSGLDEEFCKRFFITKASKDKDLCPWCKRFLNNNQNGICVYGERHGFCADGCNKNNVSQADEDTYSRIVRTSKSSIIDIPGMFGLYEFYSNLVLIKLNMI